MVTGTLVVRDLQDDDAEVHTLSFWALQNLDIDTTLDDGFETISHAWHEATDRDHMTLDGVVVDMPESSCMALRAVSLQDQALIVWIDAVCIN